MDPGAPDQCREVPVPRGQGSLRPVHYLDDLVRGVAVLVMKSPSTENLCAANQDDLSCCHYCLTGRTGIPELSRVLESGSLTRLHLIAGLTGRPTRSFGQTHTHSQGDRGAQTFPRLLHRVGTDATRCWTGRGRAV